MKKKATQRKSHHKSEAIEADSPWPLLDPHFSSPQFDSFQDMAKGFDALIHEFYRHYDQAGLEDPSMFGFVSVAHEVKFEKVDRIRTENVIGQKTTVIYAPLIVGEALEERCARELRILAAFDPGKRTSHILALNLLMTILGKRGVHRLIEKQAKRGA